MTDRTDESILQKDYIDSRLEVIYLIMKKIEKITFGFIKAKEPNYLWNGGWHD